MFEEFDNNDTYNDFDKSSSYNKLFPKKCSLKNYNTQLTFVGFFFLLLIMFSIAIGQSYLNTLKYERDGIKAPAVITNIIGSGDSHSVYVEFMIDNNTYRGRLNFYSSSMKTGDTHYIYYLPDNPNDFVSASISTPILFYVILTPTLGCFGYILFILFKKFKTALIFKQLIVTGKKTSLTINYFKTHWNVKILGKHPSSIICFDARKELYYYTTKTFLDISKFTQGDRIYLYSDFNNETIFYIDYKTYLKDKNNN